MKVMMCGVVMSWPATLPVKIVANATNQTRTAIRGRMAVALSTAMFVGMKVVSRTTNATTARRTPAMVAAQAVCVQMATSRAMIP